MNYTEQQLTAAVVSAGLRPALASSASGTPTSLLELIEKCWAPNPMDRPSFDDIVEELKSTAIYDQRTGKEAKDDIASPCMPNENGISSCKGYQENLNWFSRGEQWSKITRSANSKIAVWTSMMNVAQVYVPTLSWGSFATCGRRESMEDTHFMLPKMCDENDIHLFGIFDGHRGLHTTAIFWLLLRIFSLLLHPGMKTIFFDFYFPGAAAAEFSARALPGYLQTLGSTNWWNFLHFLISFYSMYFYDISLSHLWLFCAVHQMR